MSADDIERQLSLESRRAELGAHRGTHRPTEHSTGVGILTAVALMAAAYAALLLFTGAPVYQPALIFLAAAGAGAWAVHAGYRKINARRVRVDLFENGMIYVDHAGRLKVFRWGQLRVRQSFVKTQGNVTGAVRQTTVKYSLLGVDGTTASIVSSYGGDAGIDAWGTRIQEAVTKAQMPVVVDRLRNGESVSFDGIVVRNDGLTAKSGSWAWHQIARIAGLNGQVVVYEAGTNRRRILAPIAAVPNYYVFLTLVDRCLEAQRRNGQQ